MKRHLISPVVALCVMLAAMLVPSRIAAAADPQQTANNQNKFALLIGIDDYISKRLEKLDGCENDAKDMRQLLTSRFGFPDDDKHIKILLSRQATRQAIVDAFKAQLIENAKAHPNAICVFHYSGHGSQVPDMNGDEEDGLDETLVPVDSRQPDHYDLTDDDLEDLINQLGQYTKNITVITDCCHSGSNVRDATVSVRLRKAETDDRPQPPQKPKDAKSAAPAVYVSMAGCLPNETAGESDTDTPQGERANGLLTRNLIDALAQANAGTTYRDLWGAVATGVTGNRSNQHPQIEGDIDRFIFGDATDRADPYIAVSEVTDKNITIAAGSLQGIDPGTLVAFYKHEATQLRGNKDLLAVASAKDCNALSATIERPAGIDQETLKTAKAKIVTPHFGAGPLNVTAFNAVAGEKDSASWKEFTRGLTGSVDPKLVKIASNSADPFKTRDAGSWDMSVVKDTYSNFQQEKTAAGTREVKGNGYFIATKDGAPLFDVWVDENDPHAADTIAGALEKGARQQRVLALDNQVSPLKGALKIEVLKVTPLGKDEWGEPTFKEDPVPGNQLVPTVHVGDKLRLKLTNTTDENIYLAILAIETSGSIAVLYPPDNAKYPLPAHGTFRWPTQKRLLTIKPPLGVETLKFIVTTKPADFTILGQAGVSRAAASGPGTALEELFRRSVGGQTTRDLGVSDEDSNSLDEWTTTTLRLVIR